MSIVKGAQQQTEWRRCKRDKIPYIAAEVRRTRACLKYDMYPAEYDLTPEAERKIWGLFGSLVNHPTTRGTIGWGAGTTYGSVSPIPSKLAIEALPKLKEIVMNPSNHRPITPIEIGGR